MINTAAGMRSAAPIQPLGHGKLAKGSELQVTATCAIQPAGHAANWPMRLASGGLTSETNAASSPRTVTGATAGIASKFAGSATQPTLVPIAISNGSVASCAAVVIAIASRNAGGSRAHQRWLASHLSTSGESRMSPAVAATESAKPHDTARPGAITINTITAVDKTAGPPRLPPANMPTSTTAPITAARKTLGCGRTKITK